MERSQRGLPKATIFLVCALLVLDKFGSEIHPRGGCVICTSVLYVRQASTRGNGTACQGSVNPRLQGRCGDSFPDKSVPQARPALVRCQSCVLATLSAHFFVILYVEVSREEANSIKMVTQTPPPYLGP